MPVGESANWIGTISGTAKFVVHIKDSHQCGTEEAAKDMAFDELESILEADISNIRVQSTHEDNQEPEKDVHDA